MAPADLQVLGQGCVNFESFVLGTSDDAAVASTVAQSRRVEFGFTSAFDRSALSSSKTQPRLIVQLLKARIVTLD